MKFWNLKFLEPSGPLQICNGYDFTKKKKTKVILGLQAFLRDKFNLWAGNGSCVEEIWKKIKVMILEGIERYVPQEILSKNSENKYYIIEVKQ